MLVASNALQVRSGIPTTLTARLYTAAQARQIDRMAIDHWGFDGYALMERAGAAAFSYLNQRWPDAARIAVVCGTGNNGGDGFVVARLAHEAGLAVTVVLVGSRGRIHGEASQALACYKAAGGTIAESWDPIDSADLIVDGLLGTGFVGELRPEHQRIIDAINTLETPVVSLDVPSGLNADTGMPQPVAVRAALTITFIVPKQGMDTGSGPDHFGNVVLAGLELPAGLVQTEQPSAVRLQLDRLRLDWPARNKNCHKGQFGHVMVVGGSQGYAGAGVLAAESALRAGAGLVTLAAHSSAVQAALVRCPALMTTDLADRGALTQYLSDADVLVVGPGLGTDTAAQSVLAMALALGKPTVLDADALSLLAEHSEGLPELPPTTIMTPHPGEAARLLGTGTDRVNQDRYAAVSELAQRWQANIVLKGCGSLVTDPSERPVGVCIYGNPGMATAGMGDVLAGLLGALLAQGLPPRQAAEFGVCVHAKAADLATERCGKVSLLPTDLFEHFARAGLG